MEDFRFTEDLAASNCIQDIGKKLRGAFRKELDVLPLLANKQRVAELIDELQARDHPFVEDALARIQFEPARAIVSQPLAPSWVFGVSPARWQAEAYLELVQDAGYGKVFQPRKYPARLREKYPPDPALWALFRLKWYSGEDSVNRLVKGCVEEGRCWFMSASENRLVPDFNEPVNAFFAELEKAGIICNIGDWAERRRVLWDSALNAIRESPPRPRGRLDDV